MAVRPGVGIEQGVGDCGVQSEGVVAFAIGEESGVAGDGRARELQLILRSKSTRKGSFRRYPWGSSVSSAGKRQKRWAFQAFCVATHLHLVASKLVPRSGWTNSLFEPPDPTIDAVAKVKCEINEEMGRFTLRSGATLYANEFYGDPANDYDVCDIRGKFCF